MAPLANTVSFYAVKSSENVLVIDSFVSLLWMRAGQILSIEDVYSYPKIVSKIIGLFN